jgi:hypothetical protein
MKIEKRKEFNDMENQNNEMTVLETEKNNRTPVLQSFADNWKIAQQYAKSDLIPDNYKNKPENVIIALGMSSKMNLDLFTIMQNLDIVKGKARWNGSFCRTLIEKTGKYKDLDLIYTGEKDKDTFGCYLQAVRKNDGKIVKGAEITVGMAKAEGWWSKKDKYGKETSKWQSLTELMLGYRAMSFFARMHCPEALSGVYTGEEIEDMEQPDIKKVVEDVL